MKLIRFGFGVGLLLMIVLGLLQLYSMYVKSAPKDGEPIEFVVQEGQGASAIASALKSNNLIGSEFWFKVYVKISGNSRSLMPGEFTITKGDSYRNIVRILLQSSEEEIQVTFPEGFSLRQMEQRVVALFDVTEEEWREVTGSESSLESHPFVIASKKPDNVDLEGYLFPDTYRFFADATAEDIARTMIDEMERRTKDIDPSGVGTMHEFLTLSSIVQKEVATVADKKRVAGIFLNRLDIGMALQSDATVNYFTLKGMPSPTFADIAIKHPYNTYTIVGLPPGPIASPGTLVMEAVANPERHDYYFFLTSPDGTAYYAKTYEEHLANRVYLR